MDRYFEIFEQRGSRYDKAMRAFPQARDAEFLELLRGVNVATPGRVYDIPAGGGYLEKFLPAGTELLEFEPSSHFSSRRAENVDLEALKLPAGPGADLVVCLAALHHIANKPGFFSTALHALRPGGWYCVGDVAAGSRIAHFLDNYVGPHSGMGHSGDYLIDDPSQYAAWSGGQAELMRCEIAPCPWHFADTTGLAAFCRDLFGLNGLGDDQLVDALDQHIGLSRSDSGVSLDWELLYLQYRV